MRAVSPFLLRRLRAVWDRDQYVINGQQDVGSLIIYADYVRALPGSDPRPGQE